MSLLYLFRHGQAGTRDHYDCLSPLGGEQARLLGEYLVSERTEFQAASVGGLHRQQETAAAVSAAYARAALTFPQLQVEPRWSEFNLYGVYQEIAPRLAAESAQFRRDYDLIREAMSDPGGAVHHTWTDCDTQVIRAWVEGRYETDVESWAAFRSRVTQAFEALCRRAGSGAIAVFTSATPIGLSVAAALDLPETKILPLVGALYNASYTVLRIRDAVPALLHFNAIPHLRDPRHRTLR